MTEREKQVMRAKNAMFILLLTSVLGLFIGNCPPWGADWQGTLLAPLFTGFIQFALVLILYHAKGDFQLPTWTGWALGLSPLSMCPELLLWPADNEVAGCCFMVADVAIAGVVYWKGQVDFSPVVANTTPAAPSAPTPAVEAHEHDFELPEAIRRVQHVIDSQQYSPEMKMAEIAALSSQFAERVSSLPVVS